MEETLFNGVVMVQPDGGFRLGTDSMLLSRFLTLPKNAVVADLGSGCGTLGLLLCARETTCRVMGLELDEQAHALALRNIARNGLEGRLESCCGDVRQIRELWPAGSVSCVISNPPYFPEHSGKISARHPTARSEATLPLAELCAAAAYLLPHGGRFALVHRPERLCDLFCALRNSDLEPKRLQFVRHTASSPVNLVLIESRRGGRPGLQYEPDFIEFTPDGAETDDYRAAYGRKEPSCPDP